MIQKDRLLNFLKTYAVTVAFCVPLAHGPHGGAFVGLLIGIAIGLTVGTGLWLLPWHWLISLLPAAVVSCLTLFGSIVIGKMIPVGMSPWIVNGMLILIVVAIHVAAVEAIEALWRKARRG